ncbi:MAG: cardiolipin synthase [Lachnospiraceae bacterium]|nr:cardiolipin synthase [Lachnospiraceae bacterium]
MSVDKRTKKRTKDNTRLMPDKKAELKAEDKTELRSKDKTRFKTNDEALKQRVKRNSKKGLQSVVFGRGIIIVLMVLGQLAMFLSMIFWLSKYAVAIYVGFVILSATAIIAIINKRNNPAFKVAWLVLIALFPLFGAAFYVFMSNQAGYKTIQERIKRKKVEARPYLRQDKEIYAELKEDSPHVAGVAKYVKRACGHPVYKHSNAKYYPLGDDFFEDYLNDLRNAKEFIFIEYFIIHEGYVWDKVLEILKEKAAAGVKVRVLYDGLCAFTSVPINYAKNLSKYGIDCRVYASMKPLLSSVQNNRDHRKVTVVDGEIAYTGGVNLSDEYINKIKRFGHWKDCAIRVTGDIVTSMTCMFLTMWGIDDEKNVLKNVYDEEEEYAKYLIKAQTHSDVVSDGYMVPYNDNPYDTYNVAKHLYLDIINRANEYVHIFTPYLILDNETVEALCYAGNRGVDVGIIVPHIPDKKYAFKLGKSYYEELFLNKVKIYEYTPGFVHSKVIVADDKYGICGSSNMDFRSFYLHYECGIYMYKCSELLELEKDYQETLKSCQEETLSTYRNYSIKNKIDGALLRLLAPLM